jgi:hypothetical protein
MVLMSFDEILTFLCDSFDELITPKRISRSNTNIIYLILKAVAKGLELINNVCVVLSNKFDPAKCDVTDLNSVASLVGTERLKGSASGLHILATNNETDDITIPEGIYTYEFDADTKFVFEVLEDTVIPAGSYVTFIAMSEKIGSFHVTAQSSIDVTANIIVPPEIAFSCTDNTALLGTAPETDLEFRKRVLNRYDGQDSMVELETTLRNLPYLFDCRVKFNNTLVSETYDGITIPPFSAVIFFSGSPRSEIAGIIANKIICPTVQLADSVAVEYENEIFVDGKHTFYITPFATTDFTIDVIYKVNEQFISNYDATEAMRTALYQYYLPEVHKDYVREDDVYNVIEGLNLTGVTVLGVNLKVNGEAVDYVSVPLSRIPKLINVDFTREGN